MVDDKINMQWQMLLPLVYVGRCYAKQNENPPSIHYSVFA